MVHSVDPSLRRKFTVLGLLVLLVAITLLGLGLAFAFSVGGLG